MNKARILPLAIVAVILGAAVYSWTHPRGGTPSPAPVNPVAAPVPGTVAPGSPEDPNWSPVGGGGTRVPPATNPSPTNGGTGEGTAVSGASSMEAAKFESISDAGTAPAAGARVPLTTAWKLGEKNTFRFEITDTSAQFDMESQGTLFMRDTQRLTLVVLAGDGTGPSKVRVTIDSFRLQAPRANGPPVDFDSRVGDDVLRRDPGFSRMLEPRLAVLGRPMVFGLDADGRINDISGADDFRERYLDAVERIAPGTGRRAVDVPTKQTLSVLWQGLLFPRLGVGEIEVGKGRAYTDRLLVPGGWAVLWRGKLDVTKVDPAFVRIDGVATASAERDPAAPEIDLTVAKVGASSTDDGLKSAWRFSRVTGGLLEASAHAKYTIVVSYENGTEPDGRPAYRPVWTQVERHLVVRRTSEE